MTGFIPWPVYDFTVPAKVKRPQAQATKAGFQVYNYIFHDHMDDADEFYTTASNGKYNRQYVQTYVVPALNKLMNGEGTSVEYSLITRNWPDRK